MVILSSNFSSDPGIWTKVTTTGSVAISGGVCVITGSAGGFNNTGIVSPGFIFDPGTRVRIKFKPSSNADSNYMMGLLDSNTFNYNSTFSCYVDGGPATYFWDGGSGNISFVPTVSAYDTLDFIARGDHFIDMYINGVFKKTSVNKGSGFEMVGKTVYFMINVDKVNGASGTLTVDDFEVDNLKSVSLERSVSSGSGFSEIANLDLGTETYLDSPLTAGTRYYYRARTEVNGAFSDYTAESNVSTSSTPAGSTSKKLIAMGNM